MQKTVPANISSFTSYAKFKSFCPINKAENFHQGMRVKVLSYLHGAVESIQSRSRDKAPRFLGCVAFWANKFLIAIPMLSLWKNLNWVHHQIPYYDLNLAYCDLNLSRVGGSKIY